MAGVATLPRAPRRSRFAEVYKFEFWYRATRPVTWLYGVMLTGLPIFFFQSSAEGPDPVNAPIAVASASIVATVLGLFVSAGLVGETATRDIRTNAHPIFYTAPLTRGEYLIARYFGAFSVNLMLLCVFVPLGLLLGLVVPYAEDSVTFGPVSWQPYVLPLLVLGVPMAFYTSALMFACATLTRRTITVYLSGVALFVLYLWVMDQRVLATRPWLLALVDPLGMTAVEQIVDYWTPAERMVKHLPITPLLLWNRLIWTVVGCGALAFTWWRFRFEQADSRSWRRRTIAPGDPMFESATNVAAAVPFATRTFGVATAMAQLRALTLRAIGDVMRNKMFLVLAAGTIFYVIAFGWEVGSAVFDTTTWPVTQLLAGTVIGGPLYLILSILVMLFAGELVWRQREARTHELLAAAPIAEWVPLAASFLAIAAMVSTLLAASIVASMILQTIQGYYHFEPVLYLQFAYLIILPKLLIVTGLALCVHVLVNQKSLGHIAVAAVLAYSIFAPFLGLRHNLLIFGGSPGIVYSDMNRFGPFVKPYVWFTAYWASWSFLFVLIAALFWVRGVAPRFRERMALARERLSNPRRLQAVALGAALVLSTGGFIFYNTNVLNPYRSQKTAAQHQANYEKRYKQFENAPLPRIVAANLRIDVVPEAGALTLGGVYTLVNDQAVAVDSLHVQLRNGIVPGAYSFNRDAKLLVDDREQGYRIYRFARPLAPGDTVQMTFTSHYQPHGFPNSGVPTAVARNGAYFDRRWLPVLGYNNDGEIVDSATRVLAGLPPRAEERMPRQDDSAATMFRSNVRTEDHVMMDMVISTAPGQTAITPGRLVRSWEEGGRRMFHYRTDAPLSFGAPVLSGEFAIREDMWRNVSLKVLYHPTHTFNLERIVASMKASLEYYSQNFGPYQFEELRVVEFPRYASFARAHPYTIAFSEGGSLLTRVESWDIDRPYFVIAHETAHQWWGNELSPARVRGAGMLSETLAQYSALMVMEKTFGEDVVRRFTDFELDYYLRGRAGDRRSEPSLIDVENQSHIYYRKGSLAMYTLRQRIGEAAVNGALKRFLDKYRDAGPPYPTSHDLYAELRAATPDSLHPLLTDLFETVTFWGVKTDSAKVVQLPDGSYRITLDVTAGKFRTDSAGAEKEIPLDEIIEIGVFGPDGDNEARGETILLEKRRITTGSHRFVLDVKKKPGRAGIDPRYRLIQRSRSDNTRKLVLPLARR